MARRKLDEDHALATVPNLYYDRGTRRILEETMPGMIVGVYMALWLVAGLTIKALMTAHADKMWWIALAVLLAIAVPIGAWCAVMEWQINETCRFCSFPLPAVVLVLEGDQWVDYVSPALSLIMFVNGSAVVLAVIAVLGGAFFLRRMTTGNPGS